MKRQPMSRQEWQEAADAADACLALEAARQYGLVTGGPAVNVARCEEILVMARDGHGIRPRPDAIERLVEGLLDREPRGQVGQPHMPPPHG